MKFDCIIPAAGLSERMGSWKLFLEYKGKTIIEHSIDNAIENCLKIIVCGGHRINDLEKKIKNSDRIILINNKKYKKGMITSIKAALPYIKTDKFFIALSDMPLIPPEVYYEMSQINFPHVLLPVYKGRRGHPVLISSILKDEILQAPDSARMKDILNNYTVSEIEIDSEYILFDVDTEKDYRILLNIKKNIE